MRGMARTPYAARRIAALVLTLLTCLSGCSFPYFSSQAADGASPDPAGPGLTVYVLDVGQADAILIQEGEDAMLVDAGEEESGDAVVSFLRERGVTSLSYAVCTHPHADHIGGMPAVLDAFPVDRILMPYAEHDTKTYERLLDKILEKDIPVTAPAPGDEYALGDAALTVLSPPPDSEFDELNNVSIAFLLRYDGSSMLFTGDMEKEAEQLVLDSGLDISCDVLKVAHHGSNTSSTEAFLEAADPEYAVISCAPDENLPSKRVLERLDGLGTQVYRTGRDGTVAVHMDGGQVSVTCDADAVLAENAVHDEDAK